MTHAGGGWGSHRSLGDSTRKLRGSSCYRLCVPGTMTHSSSHIFPASISEHAAGPHPSRPALGATDSG